MVPEELERVIYGSQVTYALHLADKHAVFDKLAAGPADVKTLAADLRVDTDTLERILLVLASAAIVEPADNGAYRLPPRLVPYLDRTNPQFIGGFVEHMVTSASTRLPQLDAYLTAGKQAVDQQQPAPFEVIYHSPESTRTFLAAMWQLSSAISVELADAADLAGVRHLVDVGGASGSFAIAALRANPTLHATVYDLPQVEPYLTETAAEHGLANRLDFVAGDFLTDELPSADCFAFGYIMSDWPDQVCAELLQKAYRSCEDNGRVLVMDRLFDDDRRGPLGTAVMNLSMHVETHGRHRTAAEFAGLLAGAGFTPGVVHRSTGDKHLIVGHRR